MQCVKLRIRRTHSWMSSIRCEYLIVDDPLGKNTPRLFIGRSTELDRSQLSVNTASPCTSVHLVTDTTSLQTPLSHNEIEIHVKVDLNSCSRFRERKSRYAACRERAVRMRTNESVSSLTKVRSYHNSIFFCKCQTS
jgi:hypothetical protein